jgi:hypothetical protein
MALAIVRGAVITKLAVTIARNFELTFKVVDPSADQRGCLYREILFKNFYLIQFLPHSKDRELNRKLKAERPKLKAKSKERLFFWGSA